jgi:hypothetical protein
MVNDEAVATNRWPGATSRLAETGRFARASSNARYRVSACDLQVAS